VISSFAVGVPVTTATSTAVVAETPSSIVSLSPQGRLLAATATTTTATPPQTPAGLTSPAVAVPRQADILAAQREAAAVRISLQSLIDNPAQRAIANSRFNPVYSALLAAAHQADFMKPQAQTRANAIPVDIPAPVLPVEQVDGISNFSRASREFVERQSPASH
jgi:hypothetical protein